jgi:uncharacterized RDD family membrane protein YckC
MSEMPKNEKHKFYAHEGLRMVELNGLPLAAFWQRALGYWIDMVVALAIWGPLEYAAKRLVLHQESIDLRWDFHEAGNVVVMLLYWGLCNYFGNGRTPGKWIARTRIVSLTGERMGLWQSFERGLGYGAAVLEGGVGFLQYFWDRNRMCAQDRLAETIVSDLRRRAYLPDESGKNIAESDLGSLAENGDRESESVVPLN